jgi:hypothetical protein
MILYPFEIPSLLYKLSEIPMVSAAACYDRLLSPAARYYLSKAKRHQVIVFRLSRVFKGWLQGADRTLFCLGRTTSSK